MHFNTEDLHQSVCYRTLTQTAVSTIRTLPLIHTSQARCINAIGCQLFAIDHGRDIGYHIIWSCNIVAERILVTSSLCYTADRFDDDAHILRRPARIVCGRGLQLPLYVIIR